MKCKKKKSNPASLLRNKIREMRMKDKNHMAFGEYVRPVVTEGGIV